MRYKLYDEEGDFQDKTTKERKNLLRSETAYTPEGINVGWNYFETLEEAIEYYNLEKYEQNNE